MLLNKRIPFPYSIRKIGLQSIFVCIIVVVVYALTILFKDVIPPMPIQIHAFLGTAISVILSFKLNQSYDRWWEAHKVWGSIVNDSTNLVAAIATTIEINLKQLIGDSKIPQQKTSDTFYLL